MPFDPSLPTENSPCESAEMRSQFLALFDLINSLATVNAAQVDAVNTLPPGSPAQVNAAVTGNTLHLSFALPQGQIGPDGATGSVGPPFANALVDSVTTVGPGENAGCTVGFDGINVHFAFSLPRGANGSPGEQGIPGNPGTPGEVSNTDLANAIGGTSANSNGVGTLDAAFADPDMDVLRQKVNELILALRR